MPNYNKRAELKSCSSCRHLETNYKGLNYCTKLKVWVTDACVDVLNDCNPMGYWEPKEARKNERNA
jgi:hypothetical protein